ncbi:hypothetical protein E6O75_ATG07992 [Venturia nashicola]|uniref:CoA-transferase family III n=1 Tax=Venturia nashicola TaxID=86259 RepID=A0A4Z1NWF5_9PEZI|nr:hypothetical protein E6O75_ATG07992 [Venturia nashicola]
MSPADKTLTAILADFGLDKEQERRKFGSKVNFVGQIPSVEKTGSEKINLSLVGAVPAAANALAASWIFEGRGGGEQVVDVDVGRGHNYIDPDVGMTPSLNGQEITVDLVVGNPFLKNIYETKDGRHVVLSAVYVDLVYQWSSFLGCSVLEQDVKDAVGKWNAKDLEASAATAGLPMAIVQSPSEWANHPHGSIMTSLPIVNVKHIQTSAPPLVLSPNPKRPLEGLKVLCATHAIAGPTIGRTLAEHGASVLQIMFTHGFEHNFVYTYANIGTASTRLNFHKEADRVRMWELIKDAHVWVDSYREGGLSKFGFGDEELHGVNPGLIISHVRCYGIEGPWSGKPGFDMQGSASSGLMAYCGGSLQSPAWPPGMVINDYTTGYFGALAVQACVLRRMREGGGFVVGPSLTGTAMSILKLFKTAVDCGFDGEALGPEVLEGATGMGYLRTLKPLPKMSLTPIGYEFLLVPIGSSVPAFPGQEGEYDVSKQVPREKHQALGDFAVPLMKRLTNDTASSYLRQPECTSPPSTPASLALLGSTAIAVDNSALGLAIPTNDGPACEANSGFNVFNGTKGIGDCQDYLIDNDKACLWIAPYYHLML